MGLQMFIEKLNKQDAGKSIPDQYVMPTRMCILLRGLSPILGPRHAPVSIADRWKKIAERACFMYPPNSDTDHIGPVYTPSHIIFQ